MMGLWEMFKEGAAFKAGMDALGALPRIIRGFFKGCFILLLIIVAIAFFKTFGPLVIAGFLIYCAWRWKKRYGQGE